MGVNVTETAAREISNIIKQQELEADEIRLRVGVKGGGCAGFSYILDLTETERDTDESWATTFSFEESEWYYYLPNWIASHFLQEQTL